MLVALNISTWCWMNVAKYQQNDRFPESYPRIQSMANVQMCTVKVSSVSWALVTWLRTYNLLPSSRFTQVEAMSDERPKSSTKWQIAGKLFYNSVNAIKCINIGLWVCWALVTWHRNYKLLYVKFCSYRRDVEWTPWIIKKMTVFWKTLLDSSQC